MICIIGMVLCIIVLTQIAHQVGLVLYLIPLCCAIVFLILMKKTI